MPEQIRRVNGYEKNAYTYYPVVIIGAGESGIAMGCRLKQALGFDQFRIFERQSGVGGTWYINRYPGVACDVPAVFYSFSFAPNKNWTTFYPPGREIARYMYDTCRKFEITDKIQLNTNVSECRWLENEKEWEVKLNYFVNGMGDKSLKEREQLIAEHGETAVYVSSETIRAKIVVSAVGGLVEPRTFPSNIPGKENFKGKIIHSARWDEELDFTDKSVVVVGTGCTAAQVVPSLTKAPYNAKSVTQLMRSPPWVTEKYVAPGGPEKWAKYSPMAFKTVPFLLKMLRFFTFATMESHWFQWFGITETHATLRKVEEKRLETRMKSIVPKKYYDLLTPDYGIGCKRRIFDATWYPGLQDPKIELTAQPLTKVNENSVIIGPGSLYPVKTTDGSAPGMEQREIPADIIVLANGFDMTRWLHPIKVIGEGSKDLHDVMDERGGAQAYQGTAMDGFPNFFIIYGPNTTTGHSSVIMASENMVNHSLNFIKLILNGDATTVDVKKEAEVAWTSYIQNSLKNTVFMRGGCSSWYFQDNGWNSTVYPFSQVHFWWRCAFPTWGDWNIAYTSKGLLKQRMRRAASLVFVLAALYSVRRRQAGLTTPVDVLRDLLRRAMTGGIQAISKARSTV